MLFLLPFMSNLPSRKGVENKHNYDGCVCVCVGGRGGGVGALS